MSIKNKLVTAVTTAGLLAGLFGSAFVPVARAAADDAAMAYTAVGADNTASSATVDYWLTTTFPVVEVLVNPDDTDDSGSYGVSVSGGTIRSCVVTEVTDADNDSSQTVPVVTSTLCTSTMTLTDAADDAKFVITLNKLAAGAQATLTGSDDDTESVTLTGGQIVEGIAATAGATILSASKTAAAIKVGFDGDATYGQTTDLADTTISSVDYVAVGQNLGSEWQFGGTLRNGYDGVLTTDTTIIATVTEGFYINCEGGGAGGAADGTVATGTTAVDVLSITDDAAVFECSVEDADGAEGDGGAFTATITTASGTVLKTISGGYLGEIASVTLAAAYSTIASDLLANITDFWTVTAKDAAGRAYALKDLIDGDNLETDSLKVWDNADTTKADITDTDAADADTDGIFDLDKEMCDDGDGPTVAGGYETRSVILQLEDGAGATVQSNTVTITCGVDVDTALVVDKVEFADSQVAPGGSVKAYVYMEDANGYAASPGDSTNDPNGVGAAVDVSLVLTNGINADITADNDVEEANTTIVAGGYFEVTIVAPITVGTTISIYNATSGSLARAYVTSDAYDAVLTVGPKKLKATADFGPAAGRKKIAFVLESASGTTKTYYRRANASGVASYTLNLRGTWTVYATFGDEISDTGTMQR